MIRSDRGVSVVVPILNGRRFLRRVFAAIAAECAGLPHEIIAIDDGSTDGSLRILRDLEARGDLRLLSGQGRGAAAAINQGVREATYPIVCQVDQDVILQDGWLSRLLEALDDPEVAAAQGHYLTAPAAGFWARVMGRDLEERYARIQGRYVNHVCTGNTAYRASALRQVGLLDESMGYGYDNDLSYRLVSAGYTLAFCRDAFSLHLWREDLRGYLRQQFGVGYGRLDVLARHPRRGGGDDVSGPMMMLHAPAMLLSLALLIVATIPGLGAMGLVGGALLLVLGTERAVAGVQAWRRSGDPVGLAFPVAHLLRDITWSVAILLWIARRAMGRADAPSHSMIRNGQGSMPCLLTHDAAARQRPGSILAIVPAYNEAESLPRVIAELRRAVPGLDLLVVNDGSTDATKELLPDLEVRWLTLSHRLGVGNAVRAGIRYATREGYEYAVRVDGDGQHRACDIRQLLAPIVAGRADVAIGSRFLQRSGRSGARRMGQAVLATCLTLLTRRRITDPTSGFWLFGPRALRMLARHHPAGYSEPELVLLLHRNGLRLCEVPIRMRPRLGGQTSLTLPRALAAFARTTLALVVVPFRRVVEDVAGD